MGGHTMTPQVSVVLPTYDRPHLLPVAVKSVLAQSWGDLELILVDDHSPDSTRDALSGFDDPRIRYLRNDENLRLPRSLNRGFEIARGRYLTWTSDDNLYAPDALARMVSRLQQGSCDFVYADYYQFADLSATGDPEGVEHRRLPATLRLHQGNHIGACFLYTRAVRDHVGDYDPELFLAEDYDYWMRAASRFGFCHIPEPLYYFRRDEHTLYCSRFCDVKSSDILARYKNGLLTEEGARDAVVELLTADMRNLNIGLLRQTYAAVAGRSWRLTQWHRAWTARYLRRRLQAPVADLLARYRDRKASFVEVRDGLSALMQGVATIEYFEPAAIPS